MARRRSRASALRKPTRRCEASVPRFRSRRVFRRMGRPADTRTAGGRKRRIRGVDFPEEPGATPAPPPAHPRNDRTRSGKGFEVDTRCSPGAGSPPARSSNSVSDRTTGPRRGRDLAGGLSPVLWEESLFVRPRRRGRENRIRHQGVSDPVSFVDSGGNERDLDGGFSRFFGRRRFRLPVTPKMRYSK